MGRVFCLGFPIGSALGAVLEMLGRDESISSGAVQQPAPGAETQASPPLPPMLLCGFWQASPCFKWLCSIWLAVLKPVISQSFPRVRNTPLLVVLWKWVFHAKGWVEMLTSAHERDTKNVKYSTKRGWGGASFPCSCGRCSLETVSLGLGPAEEVGRSSRRALWFLLA